MSVFIYGSGDADGERQNNPDQKGEMLFQLVFSQIL